MSSKPKNKLRKLLVSLIAYLAKHLEGLPEEFQFITEFLIFLNKTLTPLLKIFLYKLKTLKNNLIIMISNRRYKPPITTQSLTINKAIPPYTTEQIEVHIANNTPKILPN